MNLIAARASIKEKRTAKKKVLSSVTRCKKILDKKNLVVFSVFPRMVRKRYGLSKKNRFLLYTSFLEKKKFLKFFFEANCPKANYSLIIGIRNQAEYRSMKDQIELAGLGLLPFKYWHISKAQTGIVFNKNVEFLTIANVFNGLVLVVEVRNLDELFLTYDVFNHEKTSCIGFLCHDRMVWFEYFFDQIVSILDDFLNMQKICLNFGNSFQNLLSMFYVQLVSLFQYGLNKVKENANICSIGY